MQYSQKNFMRIIGNDQKNNGQKFWEILERIIGKIASIIDASLTHRILYIGGGKGGAMGLQPHLILRVSIAF